MKKLNQSTFLFQPFILKLLLSCLLATFIFTIFPNSANAKLFRNAYVSFQLPNQWNCHLEATEWLCRSNNKKDAREAIIILTAKEVGPSDSLKLYENFLTKPKMTSNKKGKAIRSEVKHIKQSKIANHIWVDSLHLNSEVVGYYTRYIATTKGRVAILVTFSAHQRFYTKYSAQFYAAINSLKVVATNNLLSRPDLAPIRNGSEALGLNIATSFPEDMVDEDDWPEEEDESSSNKMLPLAILLLALGGYVFIKKKQKKP